MAERRDREARARVVGLLLALAKAERSAVMRLDSPEGQARLRVHRGELVHASVEPDSCGSLGDLLAQWGAFDVERHTRALSVKAANRPIGPWLAAFGVSSEAALQLALRVQLELRLANVLSWRGLVIDVVPFAGPKEGIDPGAPGGISEVILQGVRRIQAPQSVLPTRGVVSPVGARLLAGAQPSAAERPSIELLLAGASLDRVLAASPSREALDLCRKLFWVGGLTTEIQSSDCSLLLRKWSVVRAGHSDTSLLGLPSGADDRARQQALRRLMRRLHPDRFAYDPALQRAAGEVAVALNRAARPLG